MPTSKEQKIFMDRLRPCLPNKQWRYNKSAHLFTIPPASNITPLKQFAGRLGLKPFWFQWRQNSLPHFDLSPARYAQALALGATQVSDEFMIQVLRQWRTFESVQREDLFGAIEE
jgi:hypothetical protein